MESEEECLHPCSLQAPEPAPSATDSHPAEDSLPREPSICDYDREHACEMHGRILTGIAQLEKLSKTLMVAHSVESTPGVPRAYVLEDWISRSPPPKTGSRAQLEGVGHWQTELNLGDRMSVQCSPVR